MAAGGVMVGRGYVAIRPEFDGDWSRTARVQGNAAGGVAGSAFGDSMNKAFGKLVKSMAVPIAAVGTSLGAALSTSFISAGVAAGAFKAAVQPQLKSVTEAADAYTAVQEKKAVAEQKSAKAQALAAKGGDAYKTALQDAEQAAKGVKDAQDAYNLSLSGMPKATQDTAKAFVGLKGDFSSWSDSLSGTTMPIFTQGINILRGALPKLTPFVEAASGAFKGFLDNLGDERSKAVFGDLSSNLKGLAGSSLTGFLTSMKNVAVGFAGILNAFAPMSAGVSGGMVSLTERFAAFGAGLRESTGFQQFMTYVQQNMPVVLSLLGSVATTAGKLVVALAPLGGATLLLVDAFASLVSMIPTGFLTGLVTTVAALAIGFKAYVVTVWLVQKATAAWAVIQGVLNGTLALNPIGLVIGALVALGAAIFIAYKKSETFRAIVQGAWQGIQAAASWAWNNVLKPVLTGIWTGLQTVGRVASWLWTSVLSPVFNFIAAAAKILFTIVAVAVLLPIIAVFKVLGAIASWLWTNAIGPAFRAIAAAGVWLWNVMLKPALNAIVAQVKAIGAVGMWLWRNVLSPVFGWIAAKAVWLWTNGIKPSFDSFKRGLTLVGDGAKWLWNNALRPVFGWIGDKASWLWNKALKPPFDNIKRAVGLVGDSFGKAKDAIKLAWDKVSDIAKKPVRFIIDKVYNNGIVPTWNFVAKAFGAPPLGKMSLKGWATGGVLPGYTPGRDPHKFYSPTGGGLELSGGEAIMRPEWTRAVGPRFVAVMNRIASSRGATGVKAALAPALGGNPLPTQHFADGGIFGWIGKQAAGVGSAVWDGVKDVAGWLKDGVESSARAGVKAVVDPILRLFPGGAGDFGTMIRKIPTRILDSIFGYGKEADKKGAGGIGGPRIQAGLKWARTQAGKDYQWGGNGNPSWDCSGLTSAIESVIRGQKPHRRWATGSFSGRTAPNGWVLNGKSPYTIGITNAGVGHTAGTLGGVNVESRGGDGVVIGKKARGSQNMMFTDVYGFMPGKYDSGGWLQPGWNYNGLSTPEAVLTPTQLRALTGAAAAGGGSAPTVFEGDLYLDSGEFMGKVHGVMNERDRKLITAARAGRKTL